MAPPRAKEAVVTERVSVVVPAYNHEGFIEEALASVLGQTHPEVEIIVVDDGSRDATAERARAVARTCPERMQVVVQENAGAHDAINAGFARATGAWLTILNSDDAYAPGRLAALVSACRATGRGWGFTAVETTMEAGADPAGAQIVRDVQDTIGRWPTIGFAFLKNNVAVSTGNLFFARDLWRAAGPVAPLQYLHDWDYAL